MNWLIDFILLVNSIPHMREIIPLMMHLFTSDTFWVFVGSIATTISVLVAAISIYKNNVRIKTIDTIKEYNNFKRSVSKYEDEIHDLDLNQINSIIENYNNYEKHDWNIIKEYMAQLERFAVGINKGIYDIDTVDRMGGKYLIEQYNILKPIIDFKIKKDNNPRNYEELGKMIELIKSVRKNKQLLHTTKESNK